MTVEVVAALHRARRWSLDEELEQRIADILRPLMKRFRHSTSTRCAPPTASRRWSPRART